MIRDTVRAYVREQLLPERGRTGSRRGTLPARDSRAGSASSACSGMHLEGYGCAGRERGRLRAGVPGARGGRQRPALARLGPGLARDVRDLALRLGGAEAGVAAADGGRRGDRLLRPDRARRRLATPARCARAPAATATTGSSTARRCGSRTARSPTSRSCGRAPTTASAASSSRAGTPGFTTQDIHQKLSLRASVTSELILDDVRLPADAQLPEAAGLRAPLSCLSRGALRDRLRRDRRRRAPATSPRSSTRHARAVRQADRRLPAHPAQARPDARQGQPGHAARAPPRAHEGRRARCARST